MISIQNVRQAAKLIKGKVLKTPLVHSPSLSRMFGGEIYLKLENLQKTGSFKIRGATYSILVNQQKIGPGGVVAASAGNHAQGVALAASVDLRAQGLERVGELWRQMMSGAEVIAGLDMREEEPAFSVRLTGDDDGE